MRLFRGKWALCNKGYHTNPECRARLVACEVDKNNPKEEALFTLTPPLEANKALFMKYACNSTKNGVPMRLSFMDIKKAYFHAKPRRNLFLNFPE